MTDEELKKEANEYAKEIKNKYVYMDHVRASALGYLAGAEPREERIEELEKENGKLEGKLADLQSEYIELENFKNNKVNELKAQLTKAKEIIQTLIESLEVSEGEAIKESKVIKEIEQFLKEMSK